MEARPPGRGRGRNYFNKANFPPPNAPNSRPAPPTRDAAIADYDWDSDLEDVPTTSVSNLTLATSTQQKSQTGNTNPLTNFFEFASKDLPQIPPAAFGQPIGLWSNDIAVKALSEPPAVGAENDIWAMTTKKDKASTFDEEGDEREYVDQYKKAMEDQIANSHTAKVVGLADEDDQPQNGNCRLTFRCQSEFEDSIIGTIPPRGVLGTYDEIWDQYDMCTYKYKKDTETLAVHKLKHKIMDALESNQVTIVEGFTGCGKTTQIPQYILERYCRTKARCNIVVTQPRRLAAVSVATRVCDEKGWDLGSVVGYQVGLSRRTSLSTRLTYVTTGILLQSLISKKSLDEYTHIIVDEVHERDLETDLLLLVLKKILVERVDKVTKVILMSATLNPKKFADYFPKWPTKSFDAELKAAIIQIPTESFYPISEIYMDSRNTTDEMGEPKVHEVCYKLAIDFIIKLDEYEKREGIAANGERGGVLVFLPGFLEIESLCTMLADAMHKRARDPDNPRLYNWTILPLHSTITSEEQQKVFHRVATGHRKIVVSTNIAESSITVTDMRYVIDFCLTKSLGCDPNTNYTCLRMEWASKDQCTQRKGRVGRVAPGCVYRLVTREFWDSLGKETVPDMVKSSLENVVLKVKNLNMGSPKSIMALAIDPPKLSLITRAVANLKEVGALTINTGKRYTQYNGDLTPMGNVMSKLPLDVKFSRLIVLGHVFGVLEESIIIAAGMSGKSPFSYPFQNRLGSFMSKLTWSNETFSDCFALLCLYRTWRYKWQNKTIRENWEERRWARQYFVQLNMMREIHSQVDDISIRLRNMGLNVDRSRFDNEDMTAERGLLLKIAIAGAFYPNYFLRTRPSQKEYEKTIVKELACYNPMHTMYFSGYPPDQPGGLYMEAIASHFTVGNLMPRVDFSGSKVIMNFDSRGDRIGRMSLGIYRGIKMRHIKQTVTFGLIRCDAAADLLKEEVNRNVAQSLPGPGSVELPKVDEAIVMVRVTHVELPDLFWVVYETKEQSVRDVCNLLDAEAKYLVPLKVENVVHGSLCVVEFRGNHFRGRVDYIRNNNYALVYLIDRGNSVWRGIHTLLGYNQSLIDKGLHACEAQAMQCRIHGIKYLAKFAGLWNEEAKMTFANYVNERCLYLKVFSVVDSVIACDLYESELCEDKKGIRHLLLEQKLAAVMEESEASKGNNYLRIRVLAGGFHPEDMNYHNQKQIKRHAPLKMGFSPKSGEPTVEATLRGPFTPLEMEFSSLCRSAHMKPVQIERSSVNSVTLDQEPYSATARLLIAGTVAISDRTGAIMARDTTIMPAVPGLVGLVTMLFCPKLEMRVNFHLAMYTGCISGLGIDPLNKKPIYADHDMEIAFDTTFDDTDLKNINTIRTLMNNILKGSTDCDINNLRQVVRRKLNELLERDRTPLEESWQETPHKWGLIDDNLLINSNPDGEEGVVFPSHSTVRMQLQPNEDYYHPSSDSETLNFEY